MASTVEIVIRGVDDGALATAKKIQEGMDALSKKLKEAGVSQEAYKKALKEQASETNNLAGRVNDLVVKYVSAVVVLGTVKKVLVDSYQTTMQYADSVRKLSQISGESTESTSRFLQVLDDYKITADDALVATRALTKQGYAPSIDTLAKLSDQYLALNSAESRNEFVLKNLGRGGLQWVEVLQKGSAALLEQGAAVDKNLILTRRMVDEARRNEIALDNLNDAWTGFKITLGNQAIPALTGTVNWLNTLNRTMEMTAGKGSAGLPGTAGWADAWAAASEEIKTNSDAVMKHRDAMNQDADAAEKARAAQDAYNAKLDELKTVLSGDLGKAQDDYNAKLDEYNKQLAAARTQKEKDTINANIAAETAAYNERAKSIIFNIQQEAILNSTVPDDNKITMITALGQAYGLYDEETAKAITSTQGWIDRVEAGNLSVEGAIQYMKDYGKGVQDTSKAIDGTDGTLTNFRDNIYHAGARAQDTVGQFAAMAEAASGMGNKVASEAVPPVAELKSNINGLPPSGTAWNYFFNIAVSGKVPGMPKRGTLSGFGAGQANNAGIESTFFTEGAYAGGPLGNKVTLVGDAPGGGMTPYTEAIVNGNYVLDAKTTKKLFDAGLLGNAAHHYRTGEMDMSGRSWTTATTTRKALSGTRLGTAAQISGTSTAPAAATSSDLAASAVDTSQAAVTVASQVFAQQQQTQAQLTSQTQQQVQAQVQGSNDIVGELREVQRLLKRMPSTTELYAIYRSAPQQSI